MLLNKYWLYFHPEQKKQKQGDSISYIPMIIYIPWQDLFHIIKETFIDAKESYVDDMIL